MAEDTNRAPSAQQQPSGIPDRPTARISSIMRAENRGEAPEIFENTPPRMPINFAALAAAANAKESATSSSDSSSSSSRSPSSRSPISSSTSTSSSSSSSQFANLQRADGAASPPPSKPLPLLAAVTFKTSADRVHAYDGGVPLAAYSQSSGTNSYDSLAQLTDQTFAEHSIDARQVRGRLFFGIIFNERFCRYNAFTRRRSLLRDVSLLESEGRVTPAVV